MTWERNYQRLAIAVGAQAPELVSIPTDVLVRMAPRVAKMTAVNFSYINVFDDTAARENLDFEELSPGLMAHVKASSGWKKTAIKKKKALRLSDQVIDV